MHIYRAAGLVNPSATTEFLLSYEFTHCLGACLTDIRGNCDCNLIACHHIFANINKLDKVGIAIIDEAYVALTVDRG